MSGIENKYFRDEGHELEQMIINTLRNEDKLTDRELAERLQAKG